MFKDIKGLEALIQGEEYRNGLQLPAEVTETYAFLAQGEYNRNYTFLHPLTGQKLVLRVNFGSQMHLDQQIGYEYGALKLLEKSGRTPKAYYVDGSRKYLDQGILVMEYLPGQALDYRTDLKDAAHCLSDIHSVRLSGEEKTRLVKPENGLEAILEECEAMVKVFMDSPLAPEGKKKQIRSMLDLGWDRLAQVDLNPPYECCINTELNSTNFLINHGVSFANHCQYEQGRAAAHAYLVDWEKPLLGDPAQDLGHFLAPTTTFWKTDVILEAKEVEQFITDYCQSVAGRFDTQGLRERVMVYIPITCLRGITWCAMAWVQYQDVEKAIFNQSTFDKLEAYLDQGYLDLILEDYLHCQNT